MSKSNWITIERIALTLLLVRHFGQIIEQVAESGSLDRCERLSIYLEVLPTYQDIQWLGLSLLIVVDEVLLIDWFDFKRTFLRDQSHFMVDVAE